MTNALGDYLRARREQTRPEQVGVPVTSARRVPGLRRDEVAMLAGISTEYYTRLEQGRDRRPSGQVLDAIARVLGMDDGASAHLRRLAESRPSTTMKNGERLRPGLAELVDALPMPAWIEGRYLDILTANSLARALSPLFTPGTNLLRSIVRAVAAGDDLASAETVRGLLAQLRGSADPDDPRLAELVGELVLIDDRIGRVWSRQDVQAPPPSDTYRLDHPQAGPLDLTIEKFHPVGAPDQLLVICRATPDLSPR